jgi:hypothetical protein
MSTESDRVAQEKYKCLAANNWSLYPAKQDVDLDCYALTYVQSATFCDGTYVGPGASFDISSSHNIVVTSANSVDPSSSLISFTADGASHVLDITSQGIRAPYILDAIGRGIAGQVLKSAGPNAPWEWGNDGSGGLTSIVAGTGITVNNPTSSTPTISKPKPIEYQLIFNAGAISAISFLPYYFGSIVGTPPSTTPNVPRVQLRSPYTGKISTVYLQSYMTTGGGAGSPTSVLFTIRNITTGINKTVTSFFNFSAPAITKYTLPTDLIVTKDDLLTMSFFPGRAQPLLVGLILQATAIITVV